MALINCSACGKQISDKAPKCPHCGCEQIPTQSTNNQYEVICTECGSAIPRNMDICPNCGCPLEASEIPQKVELTSVKLSSVSAKTKSLLVAFLSLVVLTSVIVFVVNHITAKHEAEEAARIRQEYIDNLGVVSYAMLDGGADAEKAGNLIRKVWYNAIYKEYSSETDSYTRPNGYFVDDFNAALSNLFSDPDFSSLQSNIHLKQDIVTEGIKLLKNPTDEFQNAYNEVMAFYASFLNLTNLVLNPSGSYSTFSKNFSDATSEVLNHHNAMQMYLDN